MKKYALNNSYFKNRRPDDPDTLPEIVTYIKQNGELPFRYDGDNWSYDTVCERQKRRGVVGCQFLTPDRTAARMAELAVEYGDGVTMALDACCGTGQITKYLLSQGFEVSAFDIDIQITEVHNYLYPRCYAVPIDFKNLPAEGKWPLIVSNPPFERTIAQEFMQWLIDSLPSEGRAVLLLPKGYTKKTNPAGLVQLLLRMTVLHSEDMSESFAHTQTPCEIVVVEKR